jgi:hypothetical protein
MDYFVLAGIGTRNVIDNLHQDLKLTSEVIREYAFQETAVLRIAKAVMGDNPQYEVIHRQLLELQSAVVLEAVVAESVVEHRADQSIPGEQQVFATTAVDSHYRKGPIRCSIGSFPDAKILGMVAYQREGPIVKRG